MFPMCQPMLYHLFPTVSKFASKLEAEDESNTRETAMTFASHCARSAEPKYQLYRSSSSTSCYHGNRKQQVYCHKFSSLSGNNRLFVSVLRTIFRKLLPVVVLLTNFSRQTIQNAKEKIYNIQKQFTEAKKVNVKVIFNIIELNMTKQTRKKNNYIMSIKSCSAWWWLTYWDCKV